VDLGLVRAVDLAIDGGELTGDPSTVVDLSEIDPFGRWTMLREGALAEAEVRRRLSDALS
jgi:tRNA A37 threonylcarbamoyladenosine synthetase subunit TsaC/SUA5/YrdC